MLIAACQGVGVIADKQASRPADLYDYNFCGSGPVYPVIGYTFATYCGPRNQIALGRTGTLSWLFPSHGDGPAQQGRRPLSEKELKHLSLLAEAVQLSGTSDYRPGAVNYSMGIDFPGRPIHQRFDVFSAVGTPANRLYRSMLEMTPDKPSLPDCGAENKFFDPIELPGQRHPLSPAELRKFQELSRAKK